MKIWDKGAAIDAISFRAGPRGERITFAVGDRVLLYQGSNEVATITGFLAVVRSDVPDSYVDISASVRIEETGVHTIYDPIWLSPVGLDHEDMGPLPEPPPVPQDGPADWDSPVCSILPWDMAHRYVPTSPMLHGWEYEIRFMDSDGNFHEGMANLEAMGSGGWRLAHIVRVSEIVPDFPWFAVFARPKKAFSGKEDST